MSRYIDADKLMLHLNDYKLQVSPSWKDDWEKMVSCLVIDTCMEAVKEQPTADVRENVRGEWIFQYEDKKYKRCSACGKTFYSIPATSNFCPNCGADMRSKS